jgi:hypothetical protein
LTSLAVRELKESRQNTDSIGGKLIMSYFDKYLKSRIGTCRSGMPFDVPHEFSEENVADHLSQFAIHELVDIFCMCEAFLELYEKTETLNQGMKGIRVIGQFLWKKESFAILFPHLDQLGLRVSPDYVRFGQTMLLE